MIRQLTPAPAPAPATRAAAPARLGWTLALTSLAYFMCALDGLVVVTALPAIGRAYAVGPAQEQWTVNAYGITWAAGMITAAALGDRYGRRPVFVAGLALFGAASAGCALAPSLGVLIAARAAQGLGAATILPLSLTILAGAFPAHRRGAIVGIWGGIGGLAIASGPLVGGALTEQANWHWIFWVNVPIAVAVAILAPLRLPASRGPAGRLDLPGAVLVSGGAAALIWSLVRAGSLGWAAPTVLCGLALGMALLGGFVAWERRVPVPMLPLRLFRSRAFRAANGTSFAAAGALLASGVFVSQWFQLVHGDSPLAAGVHFLPMMAAPLLITPVAGRLADRYGPRRLIAGGLTVQAVGLAWFAVLAQPTTGYAHLVAPLILAGVGFSMALMTTPTAALGAVPPPDLGRASGVNGTLTRFGGAFGVAVATAAYTGNGFRPALLVAAALAGTGALAALAIGGRPVPVSASPATGSR